MDEAEGEVLDLSDWEGAVGKFAMQMSGDSMSGDMIADGDFLIFDRDAAPAPGQIVLVRIGGEHRIGRLEEDEAAGCTWLRRSNPGAGPIRIYGIPDVEAVLAGVVRRC